MTHAAIRLLTLASLALPASLSAQQAEPLTPEEVGSCASMALDIKNRSEALQARADRLKNDRETIEKLYRDLRTYESGATERFDNYQSATSEFREKVRPLQEDVNEVNVARNAFYAQCSGRPYNPADLTALPPEQQAAMEEGPADISVPSMSFGPR